MFFLAIPLHREHILTFLVATDLHFDPYLKSCHKGAIGSSHNSHYYHFCNVCHECPIFLVYFCTFFVEYPINMSSENGTKNMAPLNCFPPQCGGILLL